MALGIFLIVISLIVICIWILFEIQRMKYRVIAVVVMALLLFGYISFSLTLKNESLDYGSTSGLFQAVKIYFSWLGSVFGNFKSITGQAINMDWGSNNETYG